MKGKEEEEPKKILEKITDRAVFRQGRIQVRVEDFGLRLVGKVKMRAY